jgi:OOP family OmpA-OmpF porin
LADGTSRDGVADGFYVGLDFGKAKFDPGNRFFGREGYRDSGADSGYKLRFGYQFIRYVAVEVGYADLGEISINGNPYLCTPTTTCSLSARTKTSGALVNAVGSWPFAERWALNGRLGAMRSKVATTEQSVPGPGPTHYSQTDMAITYGAGVSFRLNSHATASVDWARFDRYDGGPTLGGGVGVVSRGSSSLASLGLTYMF